MRQIFLMIMFVALLCMTIAAQDAKPAPPTKTSTETHAANPLALTAEETAAFEKLDAEIKVNGQKLQSAVTAFVAAEDEDAFIASATKLQLNLKSQNKLGISQRDLFLKVQKAHNCEKCNLTSDFKTLVRPEPEKK